MEADSRVISSIYFYWMEKKWKHGLEY